MTVTIIQTADPIFYYPMLLETSKTVRALCASNGFSYEQYVGIKRGHMPWHASFNRVYMLKEMLDRGVKGWVLYLDADAFVRHLDFDIAGYFAQRSSAGAIFAGYCDGKTPYDINSGGFAVNLSDPVGQSIILDWFRHVDRIPDELFDGAIDWAEDVANDQHLLWHVLHHHVEERRIKNRILFEPTNQSYVNNGPFITQHLRSMHKGFDKRLQAIRAEVDWVLGDRPPLFGNKGPGIYMTAHHPRWLTSCGRRTDLGIEATGQAGGLLFGPYLRLKAGRHVARLFGAARLPNSFRFDVATDRGHVVIAAREVSCGYLQHGLLAELDFELGSPTDSLEVRVEVDADVDLCIHAVQILPADG